MSSVKLLKVEVFPCFYRRIAVTGKMTIGRGKESDIVLDDASVSTTHASVDGSGDEVWLQDLKSSNGTLVNDVMIHKHCLEDGDEIAVGYASIKYSIEPVCENRFDLDKDKITAEQVAAMEDIEFTLSSQQQKIDQLHSIVCRKMANLISSQEEAEKYCDAIGEALKNANIHGNNQQPDKQIRCRLRQGQADILCMIEDQGNGFDYREIMKKAMREEADCNQGIMSFLEGADWVEYSQNGNFVVLAKKLALSVPIEEIAPEWTAEDTQQTLVVQRFQTLHSKFLHLRYFANMLVHKHFPIEIIISSEELRTFPENIETTVAVHSQQASGDIVHLVTITPVCPGCLCTPGSREVSVDRDLSTNVKFWLTPLAPEKNCSGSLEIVKNGKVIQMIELPFSIRSSPLVPLAKLAVLVPVIALLAERPNSLAALFSLSSWSLWTLLFSTVAVVLGICLSPRVERKVLCDKVDI